MTTINSAFVITIILALSGRSNSFSYNQKSNGYRVQTSLNAESSSALHYRQGSDFNYAPSTLLHASSTSIEEPSIKSDYDLEQQIEAALNNARDMDRKFGLCTQPSIRAWELVDELYLKSAASQKIEDCVKSVLGSERSIWSLYE